ncbi:hypothetical protein CANARDRAFT_9068 [[Candida] arabinofermentans NRRL YB-2248]|uniref:Uncharacterized protein n=1 Tax=[Candida] arabinofermentans NRRL YB-2248 TaxID=983967 RepID=A0A1E4SX39_9ASCO|nr:hypothetical protein CANARDRAFT_9068 [[Candida] arabinofermentans NRRL YB-2248]
MSIEEGSPENELNQSELSLSVRDVIDSAKLILFSENSTCTTISTSTGTTTTEIGNLIVNKEAILTLSLALSPNMIMDSLKILESRECFIYTYNGLQMLLVNHQCVDLRKTEGALDSELEMGTNIPIKTSIRPEKKQKYRNEIQVIDLREPFCTCLYFHQPKCTKPDSEILAYKNPEKAFENGKAQDKWCHHILAFELYFANKNLLDIRSTVKLVELSSVEEWITVNKNCIKDR